MSLLKELTDYQIVEAISYFPALKTHSDLVIKASKLTTLIDDRTKEINNYSKNERLKNLIEAYFNLEAYKVLNEESSLTCWMTQFIARKQIIDQFEDSRKNNLDSNSRLQAKIYELINNPIIDYKNYPLMYSPYISTNDLDVGGFSHLSINTLDVGELMRISEPYIKDGTFEFIDKNYHWLDYSYEDDVINTVEPPSSELLYNLCELRATPIKNIWQSQAVAVIDLDIDDKQLIKEFSAYLKHVRKESGTNQSPSESLKQGKRKSWVSHRVLQYLDIKILDLYINKKHTLVNKHSQLEKIIFPVEDPSIPSNGEPLNEKIRRSTADAAHEIMNSVVIRRALSDENKVYMQFL